MRETAQLIDHSGRPARLGPKPGWLLSADGMEKALFQACVPECGCGARLQDSVTLSTVYLRIVMPSEISPSFCRASGSARHVK